MLSFPNAKINLGLNVVSKRPDNYHNIESCFYPIPWCDILEIIPDRKLTFTSSGLNIPGHPADNLCLKAYHLLKESHHIPAVHIHLHKVIPMGAGLGGGSSDAAFTLKLLNELFHLALSPTELEKLATRLGSDCAFFIRNQPMIVTGTGTDLKPTGFSLSGKFIALSYPDIHISTAEAYSQITPHSPSHSIEELLALPANEWPGKLKNDFEIAVCAQHPRISQLKAELYQQGAVYAAMTGSGSTVYGLFDKKPALEAGVVLEL